MKKKKTTSLTNSASPVEHGIALKVLLAPLFLRANFTNVG